MSQTCNLLFEILRRRHLHLFEILNALCKKTVNGHIWEIWADVAGEAGEKAEQGWEQLNITSVIHKQEKSLID